MSAADDCYVGFAAAAAAVAAGAVGIEPELAAVGAMRQL